jgi:hypothetical protein
MSDTCYVHKAVYCITCNDDLSCASARAPDSHPPTRRREAHQRYSIDQGNPIDRGDQIDQGDPIVFGDLIDQGDQFDPASLTFFHLKNNHKLSKKRSTILFLPGD